MARRSSVETLPEEVRRINHPDISRKPVKFIDKRNRPQ